MIKRSSSLAAVVAKNVYRVTPIIIVSAVGTHYGDQQ
jgi:hypothetical protein